MRYQAMCEGSIFTVHSHPREDTELQGHLADSRCRFDTEEARVILIVWVVSIYSVGGTDRVHVVRS